MGLKPTDGGFVCFNCFLRKEGREKKRTEGVKWGGKRDKGIKERKTDRGGKKEEIRGRQRKGIGGKKGRKGKGYREGE